MKQGLPIWLGSINPAAIAASRAAAAAANSSSPVKKQKQIKRRENFNNGIHQLFIYNAIFKSTGERKQFKSFKM